MQMLLRSVNLTLFLLASAGSVSAMDQSAMEETNCLMACDANQENCLAAGPDSAHRNHSLAEHSLPREQKSSPAISFRRTTGLSEVYDGTLSHPKEGKR